MGLEEEKEKGDGAAVDPENPAGNYCCYFRAFYTIVSLVFTRRIISVNLLHLLLPPTYIHIGKSSEWKRLQSLLAQLRKAANHPYLFPGKLFLLFKSRLEWFSLERIFLNRFYSVFVFTQCIALMFSPQVQVPRTVR